MPGQSRAPSALQAFHCACALDARPRVAMPTSKKPVRMAEDIAHLRPRNGDASSVPQQPTPCRDQERYFLGTAFPPLSPTASPMMTPQPTRGPELPAGWLLKSSTPPWTTMDLPTMSLAAPVPAVHLVVSNLTVPLPSRPTLMLPTSPG